MWVIRRGCVNCFTQPLFVMFIEKSNAVYLRGFGKLVIVCGNFGIINAWIITDSLHKLYKKSLSSIKYLTFDLVNHKVIKKQKKYVD